MTVFSYEWCTVGELRFFNRYRDNLNVLAVLPGAWWVADISLVFMRSANWLHTRLPQAGAWGSGRQLVYVRREMFIFMFCVRPTALPWGQDWTDAGCLSNQNDYFFDFYRLNTGNMHVFVTGGFWGFKNITLFELPAQNWWNHKIQLFRWKQTFPNGIIVGYALQKKTGLLFIFNREAKRECFHSFSLHWRLKGWQNWCQAPLSKSNNITFANINTSHKAHIYHIYQFAIWVDCKWHNLALKNKCLMFTNVCRVLSMSAWPQIGIIVLHRAHTHTAMM